MRRILHKLNTRLTALLAAGLLLLCTVPVAHAAEASGKCGDNLEWTLSGDTLTITGSGPMYDYPESTMAPWYEYRKEISTLSLPDGLTRVGNLAFYGCSALKSVRLPDSVREVGWFSFAECTGLVMLNLGNRLQVIEEAAFRSCSRLTSVRLPNSLITLSFQAFYRCESLTEITIPASVTEMGMTTFAYCYDLVRATILAPISRLPEWTFYGCEMLIDVSLPATLTGVEEYAFYNCENLYDVEYQGSEENRAQIKEDIVRDLEGKGNFVNISANENLSSSTSTVFREDGKDIVSQTITTTQTENASISSSVEVVYPGGSADNSKSSAKMNITLENSDGWSEAIVKIAEMVDQMAKAKESETKVDLYVKDDSAAPAAVLDTLAGKQVTVAVQNASGAAWQAECADITAPSAAPDNKKGDSDAGYDFSYERLPATEGQAERVGGTANYRIKFSSDSYINAEVMIKLPVEHARQRATLYQVVRNDIQPLQTVIVDNEGYAHFYLGRVDSDTVYLIGINVPQKEEETEEPAMQPIIPQSLQADYGAVERIAPMQYVLTGRTSSWGINVGQVTWLLIGGMVIVVAVVGMTMYVLNKRKLMMGYVPDLGDEDEEE